MPGPSGDIFVLRRRPAAVTGYLIVVPPFAEEMNKSRRMFTLLSQALATRGVGTVLFDLFGTGDSAGDFAAATWQAWQRDLACVTQWLVNAEALPYQLLGVRLGALLALDSLTRLHAMPERFLFWQPVVRGQLFLDQFLRLRLAAELSGGQRENRRALRERWQAGSSLEIAGYEVAAPLAAAIDPLDFASLVKTADMPPMHWLEVGSGDEPALAPASVRVLDELAGTRATIESRCVPGEPFWALQEITVAPALIEATIAAAGR